MLLRYCPLCTFLIFFTIGSWWFGYIITKNLDLSEPDESENIIIGTNSTKPGAMDQEQNTKSPSNQDLFIPRLIENALQNPKPSSIGKSAVSHLEITHQNESSVFSQNGEDGVIAAIFDQIGVTDKFYVEFGTENGDQTNTRKLREQEGWTGLLMDGGFEDPAINLHQEMLFHSNIVELFQKYDVPMTFDLLSTDTDFKDFWISQAIMEAGYRPRVIISEINSSFEKELAITVPRDIAQSRWSGSYYFGATPMAMTKLYREYGYSLVYCEVKGVNCFWVRNDQLNEQDVDAFNEEQYILDTIQCARYNSNQGAHPTDLSPSNTWQQVVDKPDGVRSEIMRFDLSNKALDNRRCK